jgi:hypothetical protein
MAVLHILRPPWVSIHDNTAVVVTHGRLRLKLSLNAGKWRTNVAAELSGADPKQHGQHAADQIERSKNIILVVEQVNRAQRAADYRVSSRKRNPAPGVPAQRDAARRTASDCSAVRGRQEDAAGTGQLDDRSSCYYQILRRVSLRSSRRCSHFHHPAMTTSWIRFRSFSPDSAYE